MLKKFEHFCFVRSKTDLTTSGLMISCVFRLGLGIFGFFSGILQARFLLKHHKTLVTSVHSLNLLQGSWSSSKELL